MKEKGWSSAREWFGAEGRGTARPAEELGLSLSNWWGARVGGFGGWFGSHPGSQRYRLVIALATVRRIGRIIYGEEVEFRWAADSAAESGERPVLLDPLPLEWGTHDERGWGEMVDVVVGDALWRAGYMRYALPGMPDHRLRLLWAERIVGPVPKGVSDPGDAKRRSALHNVIAGAAGALYEVVGYLFATGRVLEAFPGYEGYFERRHEYAHSNVVKAAVEKAVGLHLEDDPRHLAAAVAVTLWLTMAPERSLDVEISPGMREVAIDAAGLLRDAAARAEELLSLKGAVLEAATLLIRFCLEDDSGVEASAPWEEQADFTRDAIREASGRLGLDFDGFGRKQLYSGEAAIVEDLMATEFSMDEGYCGILNHSSGSGVPIFPVYSKRVMSEPEPYRDALEKVRPLVSRTRAAFTFRNEVKARYERALRRGSLDEGSIHKLALGDPRIFERRELEEAPIVHLGVLIDQSGSMYVSDGRVRSRNELAREAAILLAEAVRGISGVRLSIWGHTANIQPTTDGVLIYRYLDPRMPGGGELESLGLVRIGGCNADGWALDWCAKQMLAAAQEGERRILLVLADGIPSVARSFFCDGYEGPEAMAHVAAVASLARRRGIEVYCLGIGSNLVEADLEAQYGPGGFTLLREVEDLPNVMARIVTRTLRTGTVAE